MSAPEISFRAALKEGAAISLVGLALGLAACSSGNPIGPSNQLEVGNNPDNFQFQASSLSRTTQTLTYSWTNTGTAADVNQSGQVDGGDATLILRDASGTEVYRRTLRSTGTFNSSPGAAGTWRIEVQLTDVSGTLNFRVQRRG
jgi:hypothetical protein